MIWTIWGIAHPLGQYPSMPTSLADWSKRKSEVAVSSKTGRLGEFALSCRQSSTPEDSLEPERPFANSKTIKSICLGCDTMPEAAVPVSASATTCKSGNASKAVRKPSRNTGSSSIKSRRIKLLGGAALSDRVDFGSLSCFTGGMADTAYIMTA